MPICIIYYNMYWLCMIATIPLATGNKLNCFISARGILAIVWHCVLLFFCFFLCVFFVDFLHVSKSSSQKKKKKKVQCRKEVNGDNRSFIDT